MSNTELIIVAVFVLAMCIFIAARSRGGPRVTEITRTVKRDEPGEGE